MTSLFSLLVTCRRGLRWWLPVLLLPSFRALAQPTLISTSPANAARAASPAGPVSATFNQALTGGSTAALKVFSAQRGGLRSGHSGSTTVSGSTVSFAPSYAFQPGETVQATVTTAATSAGGSLAAGKVWQFTAAAGVGPGTFGGGSDPAAGGPMAVGDVDGDGDLDLLAATQSSIVGTVSIRLNDGSGTFSGGSDPSVGSLPTSVVVGDVDGDGDLDLLTANLYDGTVSVRLNNGSGDFSGGSDPAVGNSPYSVAVGDVDGDGDLDLLTANSLDKTVSVRLNQGNGTFSGGSDYGVGSSPHSVAVGDVDGDGDLDLLTANFSDNTVSVRINNGSGSFGGGSEVSVGTNPNAVTVGDVDGDGDLDLLAANPGDNTVSVRLNQGSGIFSGGSNPTAGSGSRSVTVGDVDGDGDLDLLTANDYDGTVSVRLNNGSGTFSGGSDPTVGSNPASVAMGDVDGDGDLDILIGHVYGPVVNVRLNQTPAPVLSSLNPTSGPVGTSVTLTGTNLGSATSVSFNGTVVSNGSFTSSSATSIVLNVPAGATTGLVTVTTPSGISNGLTFTVTIPPLAITSTNPTANARAAAASGNISATFNQAITSGSTAALKVFSAQRGGLRSGHSGTTAASGSSVSFAPSYALRPGETVQATITTAATAAAGGSLAKPRVFQFTTAVGGTGRSLLTPGSDPLVGATPLSVTPADVDGDGDLDLLTANFGGTTVSVRLNNGSGSFGGGSEVSVGTNPYAATVGDVDGDGDLDLVAANFGSASVSVRLNNGGGSFGGGSEVSVNNNPNSLALSDVDGDGDLDLLVSNNGSNTVSVRFNDGSGSFGGSTDVTTGAGPYYLATGDVDGDGDLDLITANANTNPGSTSILLNDGSGSFSSGSSFADRVAALGDVDGDGDLDIVANGYGLSVWLNNGSGSFSSSGSGYVGTSPGGMALGDLDGDGDLDLAVVTADNTTNIRLNNGSGVFSGSQAVAVGKSPFVPQLADVDGDLDLDLLTANQGNNTVSIRLNQPAPALTSVSPGSGAIGSTISLTGTNLTGATSITFAGSGNHTVTSGFTVNAAGTQITGVVVPTGAASGPVIVTTPSGPSNGVSFTVLASTGYAYTGAPQTYTVPVGVTRLQVVAQGGGFTSGKGAVTTAILAVVPGEVLTVVAGGAGSSGQSSAPYDAGAGGYNGGGAGGSIAGGSLNGGYRGGDGGHGASDLRRIAGATVGNPLAGGDLASTAGSRLVVAGGAGGGGVDAGSANTGTANGAAGTASSGGAGGIPTTSGGFSNNDPSLSYAAGEAGSTGQGGQGGGGIGGNPPNPDNAGGDGGGGGYFGGGGGAGSGNDGSTNYVRGSGGGGSSYVAPAALASGNTPSYALATARFDGSTDNGGLSLTPLYDAPTLTALTPASGPTGSTISLSGTNLTGATSITFTGSSGNTITSGYTVSAAGTQITGVIVPAGATTGLVTVTTPGGTSNGLPFTVTSASGVAWNGSQSTDWFAAANWSPATVPTASLDATVPAGAARMPVIGSGTATTRTLAIAGGATLSQSGSVATTLDVRGDFVNSGTFAPGIGAVVMGTTAVSNGPSILNTVPTTYYDLTVQANGVLLGTSVGTAVRHVLLLNGSLVTQSNPLTLRSDATGTAMVVNSGPGAVIFGQATYERYISPDLYAGAAYRHVTAPVGTATVGDLATGGFVPTLNDAYNTSATPGAVQPYPTVFGYDQSRLATVSSNYSAFNKGWYSPAAPLTPGIGFAVHMPANLTLRFTGPQNNAPDGQPLTVVLSRNTGATAPDAGWALVGNPFPAPMDYALVAAADRPGLDAAIYVAESNGAYTGSYRASVNGVGGNANSPSSLLAMGQAFFVRVSAGQTSGSLSFRNSQRLTSYQSPVYHRPAADDPRPLAQLALTAAAGNVPADEVYVYFEDGATAGQDAAYDATKLPNTTGLNLSARTTGGLDLAIQGLPTLGTASVTVPLAVQVPAPGSYTLTASSLRHLDQVPTYLRDQQTGALIDLARQPAYAFTVSSAAGLVGGRFELLFSPGQALAAAPASLAAQVSVYPNPAPTGTRLMLELPASLPQAAGTAELLDALGRVVCRQLLPAGQRTQSLPLTGLPAGVYALRLSTSAGYLVRKLTVE